MNFQIIQFKRNLWLLRFLQRWPSVVEQGHVRQLKELQCKKQGWHRDSFRPYELRITVTYDP